MGGIFVSALLVYLLYVLLRCLIGKSDTQAAAGEEVAGQAAAAPPPTCWQQMATAIPNCRTVVIGLLVVFGLVEFFAPELPSRLFDISDAWSRVSQRFWTQETLGKHVAVAVSSPSVQTRERLINDRFEQAAWMDMVLQSTMTVTAPNLRMPDEKAPEARAGPSSSNRPRAASREAGAADDDPKGEDGKGLRLTATTSTEVTDTASGGEQAAWFFRMRYFRDLLRAERADAMLDDRHDLDDDTLYRFSFDVSVAPEPAVKAYAAVQVMLTNDPRELHEQNDGEEIDGQEAQTVARFRQLQRRDIFDIYMNWLQATQSVIQDSLEDADAELRSPAAANPDLFEAMRIEACKELAGVLDRGADYQTLLESCRQVVRGTPETLAPSAGALQADEFITHFLNASAERFRTEYAAQYYKDVGLGEDYREGSTPPDQFRNSEFPMKIRHHLGELKTFNQTNDAPLARFADDLDIWDKSPEKLIPKYQEIADYCFADGVNRQQSTVKITLPALQPVNEILAGNLPDAPPSPPTGQVAAPRPPPLSIPCPPIYKPIDNLLTLEALLRAMADRPGLLFDTEPTTSVLTETDPKDESHRLPPADSDRRDTSPVGVFAKFQGQPPVRLLRSTQCLEARQLEYLLRYGPPEVWPGRGGLQYTSFFDIKRTGRADGHCLLALAPKTRSLFEAEVFSGGQEVSSKIELDNVKCEDKTGLTFKVSPKSQKIYELAKKNSDYERAKFLPVEIDGYFAATESPDAPSDSEMGVRDRQDKSVESNRSDQMHRLSRWDCKKKPYPSQVKVGGDINVLGKLSILLDSNSYTGDPPAPMTQAFPYELTPRASSSHKLKRQEAAALGAVAASFGLNARSGRNSTADYEEESVVGFVPHRTGSGAASGRPAEFGWIIAPRPTPDVPAALGLETDQLGALVAIPSWWRTVLARICTTAVRVSGVAAVVDSAFWFEPANAKCRTETLRLPGTGLDVSRHLGIQVLTTPYIRSLLVHQWASDLRAGEPGKVLLHGGRLWRNTVVTMGGQRADQIVVLPDLKGIIAEFRCVEIPHLLAALPEFCPLSKSGGTCYNQVPVKVWTSEGETSPTYVAIQAPIDYRGCKGSLKPAAGAAKTIDFKSTSLSIGERPMPAKNDGGQ